MRNSVPFVMTAVLAAVSAHAGESYRVFDPVAVPATGEPSAAVLTVAKPARLARRRCDIVIAGGGMGGVSAALAAARQGAHVCLTEPTRWLGGQMTSQGVSALDENQWIEKGGAARSYLDLRRRLRNAYAPKLPEGQQADHLNPGACWVGYICFEAPVGVRALDELLAGYVKSGAIVPMLRTAVVEARRNGDKLRSLVVYNFEKRKFSELAGNVFIDATELGELLPLAGVHFTIGAESRAETGEPDAPEVADPKALQGFTYPFVLARAGLGIPFTKPASYGQMSGQYSFTIDYGNGRKLQYGMVDHTRNTPGSFWNYRRLVAADQFRAGAYNSDLTMINWPSNDACNADYLSSDPLAAARAFQYGKQLALGFAWWLKNEAPHDSGGGKGFSGLVLRGDLLGSTDGLSLYPYIRESRRMAAIETLREQDVAEPWQPGVRARAYRDTAGIGFYPIDIHGCSPAGKLPKSKPYQVPYGALISREVGNLLAACKNLGVTHITNGAVRLHPTEWAIGEAAGVLAAAAVRDKQAPADVYRNDTALRRLQQTLLEIGHPLTWFDDVTAEDAAFDDIQWAALAGIMPPAPDSLSFRPTVPVTGAEAAAALKQLAGLLKSPLSPQAGLDQRPSIEWRALGVASRNGTVLRAELAEWLHSRARRRSLRSGSGSQFAALNRARKLSLQGR